MKKHIPFFVPFSIRNKIINDNNKKDIEDLPPETHYEVLSSYMTEKQIFDSINKRIGQCKFSKAKANFSVANSVEAFKNNKIMTRSEFLKKYKVKK